jgi:hypothetical protein
MVGNKPAIVGKVLRACHVENGSGGNGGSGQRGWRDDSNSSRYLEIQLDASSNRAARYLINAASNKSVVMDMGLVLQAETAAELPEKILGGLRVHRLSDLSAAGSESFNDAAHLSAAVSGGVGHGNNGGERSVSGLGSTIDGGDCHSGEFTDADSAAASPIGAGAAAAAEGTGASDDSDHGFEEGDLPEPHRRAINKDSRRSAGHFSRDCEGDYDGHVTETEGRRRPGTAN